jgi:hypothetical protein
VRPRPGGGRELARDLRAQACIALTVCILSLLATPDPAAAAQLGEAEANEVRHVDEHGQVDSGSGPRAPIQRRAVTGYGQVKFDLPPPSKTPAAVRAPGTGGAVYYIQTEDGLVECSSDFVRAGACRPASITAATMSDPFLGKSFYGAHWIVKRGGRWLDCHGPRKGDVCGPFRDFPFPR